MRRQLENIVSFNKSIINDYIDDYDNYWEFLRDLKRLIVEIGKNLDHTEYSEISPNIWINKTASVHPSAIINPPCIIGGWTEIRVNAFIRGGVIIGNDCVIGNSSELKNAVLFDCAKVPHFNYIGDSILGYGAHFGAGSLTSNVKSDSTFVKVVLNDKKYETNMKKVGAIVGDNAEIGCNAVLTPGVVIGKNSNVYPLVMVRGEIKEDCIVKSTDNIVVKVKRKF